MHLDILLLVAFL